MGEVLKYRAQVLVIGGGATGVGILRDLSMRGISAILFEQGDLANGTSSRFHGLLHSGARYAATDPPSARECSIENKILKQTAPGCIKSTKGWFVHLDGDDQEYVQAWLKGCHAAGIVVEEVELAAAYRMEPLLRPGANRIFEVEDAAIDGFKLVWANARSARKYGGSYYTYHNVEMLIRNGDTVTGLTGRNMVTGEEFTAYGDFVINAAGAWSAALAVTAGLSFEVICDKGTLLAFNQRLFQRVINRLRAPTNGDIFVPHENITIFGTTSQLVADPDDNSPSVEDVRTLLELGAGLMPDITHQRIIRAFAGVRPLYQDGAEIVGLENEGRSVSRTFVIIDHKQQDGVSGLLSIVGGKLTTYRLMAEKVTDLVAARLGHAGKSRTAEEILWPEISSGRLKAWNVLPASPGEKLWERWGEETNELLAEIQRDPEQGQLLCECELVSRAEVQRVITQADTHHLSDIRRKTRLGMGTCQGAFCTYRALALMGQGRQDYDKLDSELRSFLDQRWKGIRPVLWGPQLRETELARAIYNSTLALKPSCAPKGLEEEPCGMP